MKPFTLKLENFGSEPDGADSDAQRALAEAVAKARGEAHAEGFAEGFAQAEQQAEAEDRRAVIALRESVRDLEFGQQAAREEAVASLGPVIDALTRAVAPELAARGLGEAIGAAVEARLAASPRTALVARCAPERAEGLALRLDDAVEIRADPALSGAKVRLEWSGGGADYDADACARAAIEAVAAFFGEAEERLEDVG